MCIDIPLLQVFLDHLVVGVGVPSGYDESPSRGDEPLVRFEPEPLRRFGLGQFGGDLLIESLLLLLQLRHGVVQGLLGVVGLLVLLLSSGVDFGGVGVYVLGIVEFHLEDTYLHGDDVLGRVYVGHVGDLECTLGEFLP